MLSIARTIRHWLQDHNPFEDSSIHKVIAEITSANLVLLLRSIALPGLAPFLLTLTSPPATASESGSYVKWELLARDHAYITPLSVSAPLGRLVVIRHDDTLCAIRFDAYHRGNDEKPPTKFNSGQETLFATAEQLRVVKSKATWRILDRKMINLVSGPIVGPGRLGFQRGRIGLHCGDAKLEWTYPNNVSLGSYEEPNEKRALVEIAPTAWTEVSHINLSDQKLHWYRYDESRKDTLISIEELPQAIH
jgi:hypothetical protein